MGGAAGFLSATGYSIDIDTPANKNFVAGFKKEFQSDPDLFAADTYGLFFLFKQAIEKAGTAEPASCVQPWRTRAGRRLKAPRRYAGAIIRPSSTWWSSRSKAATSRRSARCPGEEAVGPDKCEKF